MKSQDRPTSPSHPAEPSRITVPRYSYYALSVLTLVNFLNYIDRQILPTVVTSIQHDLHLSDTEFGALEGALLISFTVLAPVFGWLGDRFSRGRLLAMAAVIWSLATGLTAIVDHAPFFLPGFTLRIPLAGLPIALSGLAVTLCLVRAIVGVGESSYSTITPTLIADYFPPLKRATALGVFQIAIPMGFALGYVIGVVLGKFFGWRMAFMIVGLPGLITAAFVWRLREPARGSTETTLRSPKTPSPTGKRESWIRTCWRILTTRDWLLSTAGYAALTFVLGAFATWAMKLLEQEKQMGKLTAGITLGVVTLLAGFAGSFGGGWIADRVAARRRDGYFLVCAASSLLGIVPALLALVLHRPLLFVPAMFFTVFFLFINNAPFHAILVGSVPPAIRATAMALNIVAIHMGGDLISRFGVGVLSDSLARGQAGLLAGIASVLGIDPTRDHLTAALLVVPAGLLISALFFLWGARKHSHQPSLTRPQPS
jgi:MFS transporter, Spinster family, sphingosine-1-phosphate transporter